MTHDRLRIYLFGEPRFEHDGTPYAFKAPPKTLPLLAYLLLHRRGAVARETLAAALWPDADQATAYSNLRRHLHYLAKALPPEASGPWIVATAKAIRWNAESPYWLDVDEFERAIQERTLRARAVRLYSGDLYERCAEEWIDFERERLRTLQLSTSAQLCADARARNAYVEALQYAQLILAADPWREDAVRTIVEIRMLLGDRAGALAEYERFAARLAEELQTQPLAETVRAYELVRSAVESPGQSAPAQATAETLFGRRNELAILRDEWQRAARAEGRLVLVGGEAGIGKTTLVRALLDVIAESGAQTYCGAASAHEESAYDAFAPIAAELGADLFTPFASDDERLRRFEAFAELLERRAQRTPLAIVLEDLHWAGGATFDLLRYLALRLTGSRVLFLGTYREFEVTRTHPLRSLRRRLSAAHRCTNVALSTLGREDAGALACSYAGRSLAAELLGRIYERSDGNPLFVIELARELRDGDAERVPVSIEEIVRERLGRLDETTRSLLETAAVTGASSSVELLVQISGLREGDVLAALDALIGAHFLRQGPGDRVSFVHEVIRQAVYEHVSPAIARATHARAGFALRELAGDRFGAVAAAAAWHFACANLPEAETAARLAAAEHAQHVYALDEAQSHASRALERCSGGAERFRALCVLEFAAAARADRAAQAEYLAAMGKAAEGLGPGERAETAVRVADFSSGEPTESQRRALIALERYVEVSPRLRAAYHVRQGEYLLRIGEMQAAEEALDTALGLLTDENDDESLVRALTARYVAALQQGMPLERIARDVQQARTRLDPRADERIAARLAFVHAGTLLDENPQACLDVSLAMLGHARASNDIWLEALAHRSAGASATRLMQLGLALRHLERSAEITRMTDRPRDMARVLSWQMLVENRCAAFASARESGARALEFARSCSAADIEAIVLANLSNTAMWSGDLETAERRAQEALELGAARGYAQSSVRSFLGEILVAKGDLSGGLALIEAASTDRSPQLRSLNLHAVHYPVILGLAYLCAGRFEDARAQAHAIADSLDPFERYYVNPHVYLWSASQLLRMTGYDAQSKRFLRAARKRKDEVLATIDRPHLRETFNAFVLNRLIAEKAEVGDPAHAWYRPHDAEPAPTAV